MYTAWIAAAVGFVVAAVCGFFLAFTIATKAAKERSESILREAESAKSMVEREVEARKKEAVLEAKDAALQIKEAADAEISQKRADLNRAEARIEQKEETIEQKIAQLNERDRGLDQERSELGRLRQELSDTRSRQDELLEQISGLSREDARAELMKSVREQSEQDMARLQRELEEKAHDEADRKARNIVSLAINRCAVDQATETTVSVVPLPSDEMKGRIIGREGRNIRSFETLTGVDLIIDDTPEAVVLSAFDPIRREVARLALTELVEDGRIHPGRIEEVIEKARSRVDSEMEQAAETALLEVGVVGLSQEIVRLIGRLKFRTSYGQNCLKHSIEVGHLAAFMASELGLDAAFARRAGFLHDIGKAVDSDVEGPHALIGQELLRKAGEPEKITLAVAAHHEEVQPSSVEAVLVQAADAISASRPGARRESLETYVKRLQKLETIAESFSGVEKTYAIQAGREIRVMVRPEQIDDDAAVVLARETAKRIEQEMEYPGQIKVTVIRETRAVDFAK